MRLHLSEALEHGANILDAETAENIEGAFMASMVAAVDWWRDSNAGTSRVRGRSRHVHLYTSLALDDGRVSSTPVTFLTTRGPALRRLCLTTYSYYRRRTLLSIV